MIITAICMFVVGIISWIISIMPNMRVDFDPQSTASFFSVIDGVSCVVPVTQAGIIIGLILLVYGIEFLWLLLNWIIAKIPFIE